MQSVSLSQNGPLRPQWELLRPRLALPDSLRRGQLGLAALFAPAGYGKSTVMAAWRDALEKDDVACCWLSIGDKHRDPKTFFQGLLAALRHQTPELTFSRTEQNLPAATSYMIEPPLATLMDELMACGKRIVVFLDNVESLGGSMANKALSLLIDHRPDNLSLVLGGREFHQLGLTQFRLAGQMIEVRTNELAFTLDEIQLLLSEQFSIEISGEPLQQLADKTEGWPAALSLYAIGNSAGGNAANSLSDFANASGELADYLGNVLLEGLDTVSQDVLLRASVPEHFSIELLKLLVPYQDPTQTMERITQSSLFLQRVDSQGLEYRFHSLCADFMRRRLRQNNPDLYRELLKITGDWCWTHGHPYEAVNYAKSAEDWPLMAKRVAEMAESLVRSTGEFDTYLAWLDDLPDEAIKTQPTLFLDQAWALGFSREHAQAEFALARLEALLPSLPEKDAEVYKRQLRVYRYLIEAFMDRGQQCLDEMVSWLKEYPDAPEIEKGLVQGAMSSASRNANQFSLAHQSLDNAEIICQNANSFYILSWVHNIRLSVHIKSGNFVDGRIRGAIGLKAITEAFGDQSPSAGMSNAMLAYLAYEKGDAAAAGEYLDNGMRFITNRGNVDALYFGHLTQSWLAADNGNDELANSILLEGEQIGITHHVARLTTQLATRRALRLIHKGDHIAAEATIHNRQLLDYPNDSSVETREQCAELLRANIELSQGKFKEAADRSQTLSRAAAAHGNMRMKAEYDFVQVIALHNVGELNAAGRKFHELLAYAASQDRYRFMLQYGTLGRGLIAAQYKSRQQSWEQNTPLDSSDKVLKQLATDLGLLEQEANAQPETSLAEGLTKREIDILRRASRTGLNNKKLAEAIFVSEGTIKWHLHNIYSKLEVRNRAGAIAQAQRLGLLD